MKRREKNLLLAEKEPDDIETWVGKKKWSVKNWHYSSD